jgi:hypothetical protein
LVPAGGVGHFEGRWLKLLGSAHGSFSSGLLAVVSLTVCLFLAVDSMNLIS